MAKVAIGFGAILIVLAGWGYTVGIKVTGEAHPTALIPAYFGLALAWCGVFAMRKGGEKRALWMHVAVTLGLVGFLFPGTMAILETMKAHGGPLGPHAVAVEAQGAMAAICLVFVLLCVRSFIAARKAREAA